MCTLRALKPLVTTPQLERTCRAVLPAYEKQNRPKGDAPHSAIAGKRKCLEPSPIISQDDPRKRLSKTKRSRHDDRSNDRPRGRGRAFSPGKTFIHYYCCCLPSDTPETFRQNASAENSSPHSTPTPPIISHPNIYPFEGRPRPRPWGRGGRWYLGRRYNRYRSPTAASRVHFSAVYRVLLDALALCTGKILTIICGEDNNTTPRDSRALPTLLLSTMFRN